MFVPRAISRVVRAPAARFSSSFRPSSLAFRPQAVRACLPATFAQRPCLTINFSTTLHFFDKQGTVDEELAAKIQSELELEKMKEYDDDMPLSLKEYLENSSFKVNDKPGEEEVQLVRNFGDEIIRVEFSIADLNAASSTDDLDDSNLFDDQTTDDDIAGGQSGGAQSKGAKSEGRIPVANDTAEDEDFDEEQPVSFPSRVNVTIEKANGGAIQFEAVAQDGMIVIDNVFYHKSAELATAKTVNADWERRGLYAGPPFSNLDEDLQVLLERYLDERGINTALALFIPDYIDYKEQKEYVSWLSNVKSFVET